MTPGKITKKTKKHKIKVQEREFPLADDDDVTQTYNGSLKKRKASSFTSTGVHNKTPALDITDEKIPQQDSLADSFFLTSTDNVTDFPRASKKKKVMSSQNMDDSLTNALDNDSLRLLRDNDLKRFSCHLEVKNLIPGSLVIGCVSTISEDGITLDLPFHNSAIVPLHHTSEPSLGIQFTVKDLEAMYRLGELFIAAVLSNDGYTIECSLRPSIINAGFTIQNLLPNLWIACVLRQPEEFGWSGSLEIGADVNCYILRPSTENGNSPNLDQWNRFRSGRIIYVGIKEINIDSLTVTTSTNSNDFCLSFNQSLDKSLLRAGLLVEAKLRDIIVQQPSRKNAKEPTRIKKQFDSTCKGAVVEFCRVLKGVLPSLCNDKCDSTLLDNQKTKKDSSDTLATRFLSDLRLGNSIRLRVLAVVPSQNIVLLSFVKNVVTWSRSSSEILNVSSMLKPGMRIKNCRVVAIDADFAVRLTGHIESSSGHKSQEVTLDIHKARYTDNASASTIQLQVKQLVPEARILSFNILDGAANAATAPSLLKLPFLCAAELRPGQKLTGTVRHVSDQRIFVRLNDYLTGIIPREHATDVPVSDIKSMKRFKQGMTIECRVWNINRLTNTVWLTSKRSLLQEEFISPFSNNDNVLLNGNKPTDALDIIDFEKGQLVYGVVGRIVPGQDKVKLHFFGSIAAQVPLSDFALYKKEDKLKQGSIVQCRITYVNYISHQLEVTINLFSKAQEENDIASHAVESLLCDASMVARSLAFAHRSHPYEFNVCILSEVLKKTLGTSKLLSYFETPLKNDPLWPKLRLRLSNSKYNLHSEVLQPGAIAVQGIPFCMIENKYIGVLCIVPQANSDLSRQNSFNVDTGETATAIHTITIGFVPVLHLHDDSTVAEKFLTNFVNFKEDTPLEMGLNELVVLTSASRLLTPSLSSVPFTVPILSSKRSLIDASRSGTFVKHCADLLNREDSFCTGYIHTVKKRALLVSLGNWFIQGLIPIHRALDERTENLQHNFNVGQTLQFKIESVDLTVAGSAPTATHHTSTYVSFNADARQSIINGTHYQTTSKKFMKNSKSSATKENDLAKQTYNPDAALSKTALACFKSFKNITLPKDAYDLVEGQDYSAVIKRAGKEGVFVYLNPTLVVRIMLSQLPESPIDPDIVAQLYTPFMTLPAVRILKIKSYDPPRIEASIKAAMPSPDSLVHFDDLKVGEILAAQIKAKIDSGIFLTFENSTIDAFCHISEICDTVGSNEGDEQLSKEKLKQHQNKIRSQREQTMQKYDLGERVAARILNIDETSRKIRVTLKASAFAEQQFETLQDKLSKLRNYAPSTSRLQVPHSEDHDIDHIKSSCYLENSESTKAKRNPIDNDSNRTTEHFSKKHESMEDIDSDTTTVMDQDDLDSDEDNEAKDIERFDDDDDDDDVEDDDDDDDVEDDDDDDDVEDDDDDDDVEADDDDDVEDDDDDDADDDEVNDDADDKDILSLARKDNDDQNMDNDKNFLQHSYDTEHKVDCVKDKNKEKLTTRQRNKSCDTEPLLSSSNVGLVLDRSPISSVLEEKKMKAKPLLRRPVFDLDTDSEEEYAEEEQDTRVINNEDDNKLERDAVKKRQKRQLQALKRDREAKLREEENKLAEAQGLIAETAEDFERLAIAEGDSAAFWIRYMAYYLKLKDPERARAVAERGVQRINSNEEEERLNLWTAYLNLEAAYGSRDSVNTVLRRSLQYNDPKKVMMKLTFVYKSQGRINDCLEACKKCVEKYPESKKMWIRYLSCLFECQYDESTHTSVRGILVRALKRLPQRKHVSVVTAVARLEFSCGSVERGRTYFEKLLVDYPKRTDIWGQYLDAVTSAVKSNKISAEAASEIFCKPTTLTGFKPRQMKYFFTRWLTFENLLGTAGKAQYVQSKAKEYVETLQKEFQD